MLRSPPVCPESDMGDSGDRHVTSAMAFLCLRQTQQGGEILEALQDHGLCQRASGTLRNPGSQEQRANPAPLLHLGCWALGMQLPDKGGLVPLLGAEQRAWRGCGRSPPPAFLQGWICPALSSRSWACELPAGKGMLQLRHPIPSHPTPGRRRCRSEHTGSRTLSFSSPWHTLAPSQPLPKWEEVPQGRQLGPAPTAAPQQTHSAPTQGGQHGSD